MGREFARAIVLAAAIACIAAKGQAADTLRVGKAALTASATLPVDVGVAAGIFQKHGLDVKIIDFQGSSKMHQAMVAGDLDLAIGAGPELALIAKGSPELAVCNADPAPTFFGIVVGEHSPIHTLAALTGKTMSVSSVGGMTYWLALELERKEGWGKNGLKIVTIGNAVSSVVAALKTRLVDAAYSSTALAFLLEDRHEGRLLAPASSYAGHVGAGVIFASDSLIRRKPQDVRRFLAGWLDTIAFMRKQPAAAIKIEDGVTHFPPSVQEREFHLTIGMFSDDCRFDAETLSNLKRSFADLKLLPSPADMAKLYTEKFIPKG